MSNNINTKKYRSCKDVEGWNLIISTNIEDINKCISPCCSMCMAGLASELTDKPEYTIDSFIKFRQNIIDENKRVYYTDNKERIYTNICVNCPQYIEKEWDEYSDTISFINLSMAPAPCQSKCIYCGHVKFDQSFSDKTEEAYERLINFIKYIKNSDFITKNTVWQISSGEITIHPYKEEIFKLIENIHVKFFSNCFKFDQGIANHLKSSPNSCINLSIDSGTAITWKKIKGFNNFNTVINNLRKYYQYCDQENHQQIELKYIVLPGINTRKQDYDGIINIMKRLKVNQLIISRNAMINYKPTTPEYNELFDNIITLASMCKSNGLTYKMAEGGFNIDEIEYIDNMSIF